MPSLPILTFDERVLSPRFGYVFHPRWLDPYESVVGMLWKFVRMNRLAGHAVVTQICRQHVDPYEGVDPTSTDVDIAAIGRLLGVTQTNVRGALCSPHSTHGYSRWFRYCPRCLSRGYHGVSHQLERHFLCPVHGYLLLMQCRHCGARSDYRLDAQLLDAPFRCRGCNQYYTSGVSVNIDRRRPMTAQDRKAVTRAQLC
jgi:hypothetical protein